MKINDDCAKRVEHLFDANLASYLKENSIFCIKYLTKAKLENYFIENNILYKDAIKILEIYDQNKDKISHNICNICESNEHIDFYQTSIFNLGSLELSTDYIVSDVIDYFEYMDVNLFNKLLDHINVANYDLDILKICPRLIKPMIKDWGFKKIKDLKTMSYMTYELIPKHLLAKFNKFLEYQKNDSIVTMQEEFIKLVTSEEERKLVLLNERCAGRSLSETGNVLGISKEWVRILELQIVNDFECYIIRNEHKLYRICVIDHELNDDLAKKYFGKYYTIFRYLYDKNNE